MSAESSQSRRREWVERGIYQNPANGRFEITWTEAGRQRWEKVVGGVKAARTARAARLAQTARGERTAPSRLTFRHVADAWLASQTELRPRTRERYEIALRTQLLPRFGRMRIVDVRVDDVARLIAEMKRAGYAAWSIRGTLTPLSRVFEYAARNYDGLPLNPVKRLGRGERPSVPHTNRRILSAHEITRLLDAAPPRYRTLIAALVFTGLRLSEVLGLVWADVDIEEGFVRVRKQLGRDGSRVATKTAQAVRDTVLMPSLVPLLRAHKEAAFAAGLAKPSDFVFVSQVGGPLNRHNVAARGIDPAVERAGLNSSGQARVTAHTFRRTFAAHLILDLKLDAVQVAKQMGHAKASITQDAYADLFEQARHADEIREAMARSAFGKLLESADGDSRRGAGLGSGGEAAPFPGLASDGDSRRTP